ncbi:hypothetical protein Meth11DRAFT_1601 [Methylophilaceae bacterium 11]|jgi:hypothetical protein|uniref:CopL family metal-binding regulatory protein n=1 Tax=Methylotenera sp. 1P/1 TaxID=1131551 RepID=UPI00036D5318|nr:CopL family metal-binding regulatory protein [Methylotenera sp. 1P/1]EUJ10773.1 hypothetical protein Meth11DRAFT_1601 [Methylophilaceae bacterium 11]
MLIRFSRLFAYVLLLVMPLQGIAAANMLVCNSTMQIQQMQQTQAQAYAMPCHAHMAQSGGHADAAADHGKSPTTACKTSCNTLCTNLCAIAALPMRNKAAMLPSVTTLIGSAHFSYASITLPSLQRPPIFLS